MIEKVLFAVGMLLVTLLIQFILFKKGKSGAFWCGTEVVFVMCILGLLSNDVGYFAGILGYVAGDAIGKIAGWHHAGGESR